MTYPPLQGALYAFPLVLGTGLVAAGLRYILDQPGTAETFGVEPSASLSPQRGRGSAGDVYMTVAGIRTVFLGANITAFALLHDRRATGVAVLLTAVVPLADGFVAFRHAGAPWVTALKSHWVGAGLAGWLAYALLVL